MPWRRRLPWIALLPAGFLVALVAARSPFLADAYAGLVYPLVARGLGILTGWLPFSVAEIILVLVLLSLLGTAARAARRLRLGQRRLSNLLLHGLVNGLAVAGLLYGGGMLLWGINYQAQSYARRARLELASPSAAELRALAGMLVEAANRERAGLEEDDDGVMRLPGTRRRALGRASDGFYRAAQIYEPLSRGYAGRPKGLLLLAAPMSWLGLSGIFLPYTGEPSVNTKLPDPALPFTACHEIAHQMGFAREEEANFVGYLGCTNHLDADYRYSGQLGALRYTMSALHSVDPEGYTRLVERCSPGVKRDWEALRSFWRRYRSPLTDLGERINDGYLRSQGQQAGTRSYGMMVELLIAHERANHRLPPR